MPSLMNTKSANSFKRLIEGLFIINVSNIVGGYALRAPLRQLDIRNIYNNPVCFVALAC
jgi:hypothetical protein